MRTSKAWEQKRPSKIVYSGLRGREWLPDGSYSTDRRVRADVFVFALETCRNRDEYNALDLAQWEFRVTAGVTVRAWDQRSIALTQLQARGVPVGSYDALPTLIALVARPDPS